jgi:NTE family protein
MVDLFGTLLYQVEKHDIAIGKLMAKSKKVKHNLFYTPTKLNDNASIYNKNKMKEGWHQDCEYAQNKNGDMSKNGP